MTRKDSLAFFFLLIVWTLAIVAPAQFGTVSPSICLPNFPYACSDSLDLNDQVVGLNLGLVFGWPIIATMIFSGLSAFLFRNSSNLKGHN